MKEELRLLLEFLRILGGEVMDVTALGATLFHVRMTQEILLEGLSDILALGDDADATWNIFMNLRQQ
jgi:hypothetical protein